MNSVEAVLYALVVVSQCKSVKGALGSIDKQVRWQGDIVVWIALIALYPSGNDCALFLNGIVVLGLQ